MSQLVQLPAESVFPGVVCLFACFPCNTLTKSQQQLSICSPTAIVLCISFPKKRAISQNPSPGSHHSRIPVEPPDGICSMFFSCNIGPHHWSSLQSLFLHHLPQLRIHLHQDNHYASYLHHFHHLHLHIFQLELDHHLPVCQNRKFNINTHTLQ